MKVKQGEIEIIDDEKLIPESFEKLIFIVQKYGYFKLWYFADIFVVHLQEDLKPKKKKGNYQWDPKSHGPRIILQKKGQKYEVIKFFKATEKQKYSDFLHKEKELKKKELKKNYRESKLYYWHCFDQGENGVIKNKK